MCETTTDTSALIALSVVDEQGKAVYQVGRVSGGRAGHNMKHFGAEHALMFSSSPGCKLFVPGHLVHAAVVAFERLEIEHGAGQGRSRQLVILRLA
jgi:hypothetical protein